MAGNRTDRDYEIDAVSKALRVFEALEGTSFEPIPIKRVIERCQLPKDFVMRTLRTYRLNGWAIQNDRDEWSIGGQFMRLAETARNARIHARGL